MTTVYDVPAEALIRETASQLTKDKAMVAPEWAPFVKTGAHREKTPESEDWWHVRCAAILRKVYMKGPIGTERLAAEFGGYRDRGARPNRAVAGSGSIARKGLQQLESAGLLTNVKGRGRSISPKGQALLDNAAHVVKQKLVKEIPGLAKY